MKMLNSYDRKKDTQEEEYVKISDVIMTRMEPTVFGSANL